MNEIKQILNSRLDELYKSLEKEKNKAKKQIMQDDFDDFNFNNFLIEFESYYHRILELEQLKEKIEKIPMEKNHFKRKFKKGKE